MKNLLLALLVASSLTGMVAAQPPDREKSRYQGGYAKVNFELPAHWPKARIDSVSVRLDAKVGFNLHLKVVAFDFDLSRLGDAGATPQGHARAYGYVHLFVNGRKRNRLYGADFYLKEIDLDPGQNQLEFVLANPQHGNWTVAGKRIVYACKVTRPASK